MPADAALWADVQGLEDAFGLVELRARARGFSGTVQPRENNAALESREAASRALPDDLKRFLLWYDAGVWEHAFDEVDAPTGVLRENGVWVAHPEGEPSEPIQIYEPADIEWVRCGDPDSRFGNYFKLVCDITGLDRSWLGRDVVEFASSAYFERIGFCPDPPVGAPCVMHMCLDDRYIQFSARSLPEWLARLAVLGLDPGVDIAGANELPLPERAWLAQDVQRLNTHIPALMAEYFGP